MEQTFAIVRSSRNALQYFLETYSVAQLNFIPPGFNNNMIWNIGHIVVVQQMLVYKLSGLPMMVSDEMVEKYKRGSKPESDASEEDVQQLKNLLFTTIDQSELDFKAKIFKEFFPFTTMTGFHITDAVTAMEFNNYHEGIHTGFLMSIRKLI